MNMLLALALSIGVLIAVWTYIALGPAALPVWAGIIAWGCFFAAGGKTAALGLFLHYAIMSVIVAVFYLSSRRLGFMTGRYWWLAGMAFGIAVWVFMTYVVVANSALAPLRPQPLSAIVQGLLVHMSCVGLPIAFITRQFSRMALSTGE